LLVFALPGSANDAPDSPAAYQHTRLTMKSGRPCVAASGHAVDDARSVDRLIAFAIGAA
jgi:hypothetical protein